MARLHLSTDVLHGWPARGTLPPGVTFSPAISRFPDDPAVAHGWAAVWPERPDGPWARRILRDVPIDFTGLVSLDNEGPQFQALWTPLGSIIHPGRRNASIAALCRHVDACKRARPRAAFGFYGVPTGGWYAPRMYRQTRRQGEALAEIYRHVDVLMPSLYCPEVTPGHEDYGEFILSMTAPIARHHGIPLAAFVATRCYSRGDEHAVLLSEQVLRPWMKMVMKYRPDHLVYWHNEPWFVRARKEAVDVQAQAERNVAWALRFFGEFAS
jgi:hypothetical protein